MKAVVIGNGNVGKAVFRELQQLREISELAIVGRNADACRAEAEDYLDAIPMRIDNPGKIYGGGYELAKDADILVYCSGPSVTAEDRLSIADKNVAVAKEIFEQIDLYAPNAIVIVVTNPLDVITTAIQKFTKRPANRVIGTGTLLDTSRLIKITSWAFNISPFNVEGFVIGEHGGSSVVLNSGIRILGMNVQDYLQNVCGGVLPISNDELEFDVRDAGFKIFRAKGYTSAGVATAVTLIVYDIINDTRRIYPVSSVLNGPYGVNGFAISVPCIIGKNGIMATQQIGMNETEADKFRQSCEIVKSVCVQTGLIEK